MNIRSIGVGVRQNESWQSQKSCLAKDITEAVGKVPIVRLNRLSTLCQNREIYLKLESCNPGGSIKEKNAVFLVRDAERRGLLREGGTIVESSSGNFGIALAMVGAARGYRVLIVVDAKTPPPVRRILLAYGAELIELPLSSADKYGSMQVARMDKAKELSQTIPGAWYPCQHLNPLNPESHVQYTAREIEEAFGNNPPDAILIGISTASQLAGIAKYFKKNYPKTQIIGVDVAGSVILGTPPHPYKMTGLGLSFQPPNFSFALLDLGYSVEDRLAFSVCHAMAKQEGLLLGGSTGALVAAGIAFAKRSPHLRKILIINPDRGDRYLETIYSPEWLEKQQIELLQGKDLDLAMQELTPVFTKGENRASKLNHAF